jgi:hypothetical protein
VNGKNMITVTLPKIFQPFHCDDLIRLGKNNDGGYLVNKQDVNNSKKLLSLGIGEDWSFEKDFISINECKLNAYDNSLNKLRMQSNKALEDSYNKFFTGNKYHLEKNIGSGLNDILFDDVSTDMNTFLKCDIEGAEYDILFDLIKLTKQYTGMVIEFHEINKPDNFHNLINFISKVDHKLVHIHINNYFYYKTDYGCVPDTLELTFTSSPNVSLSRNITLPNKLDMQNNPEDEEFKILF